MAPVQSVYIETHTTWLDGVRDAGAVLHVEGNRVVGGVIILPTTPRIIFRCPEISTTLLLEAMRHSLFFQSSIDTKPGACLNMRVVFNDCRLENRCDST